MRALEAHVRRHDDAERADDSSPVTAPGRHRHLLRLGCAMRRVGAGERTIAAALLAENAARCTPPKDEQLVLELAKDIVNRYPPGAAHERSGRHPRDGDASYRGVWLERASDLLAEPDPGPTPYLVDQLLVDRCLGAIQGAPKIGKTWVVLECGIAVVTGRKAFGRFAIPTSGPVMVILEEAGRAALHRRLDALARGNAIDRDELAGFHFAANRRNPARRSRLAERHRRRGEGDQAARRPLRPARTAEGVGAR